MSHQEARVWNSRILFHCPSFHDWRPAARLGRFFDWQAVGWWCRLPQKETQVDVTDDTLRRVLTTTRVIALVGWSPNPDRPSHRVAAYLSRKGYRVIPVNPGQAGAVVRGEAVRATLSDIDTPVDMVDIFRRSSEVGPVVADALRLPGLQTIWMQLGVVNEAAAAQARAAGVTVVMNRCPAIEYPRLIGSQPIGQGPGA